MNIWRWLTTPDPEPGFTRGKIIKLTVRVFLFAIFATLVGSLLRAVGLGPYLDTWWGTLLFVLLLYVPLARYLMVDTFAPSRVGGGRLGGGSKAPVNKAGQTSAERRKERNRYAGVRKSAPKGGRR
ncbi:hypothetical protein ACFFLM_26540 [Deinococcus oregonensis]|uniref:Uncharacterized protein n=1 Tax=Deinococcus oregonensis TaxID=1805970 RepID=A0ABV6B948_9DEIO